MSDGPERYALIIGAMKSGTTSLFEILAQHPEITGARVKEPDFFSEPEVFGQGWDWYRALWEGKAPGSVSLEASVSYTKAPIWPDVPDRIASMPDADVRFIYMVRHPVTRIASQVRHSIFEGWGASLDEGIPEDAMLFSRYAMQLDHYLEHFPSSSIMVVTLEEFRDRPRAVLSRICSFLEVDAAFEFDDPERRYNKGDLYGVSGFWSSLLHMQTLRAVAERIVPRGTRHRIRDWLSRLGEKGEPEGRSELDEAEKAQVLEELAPDMRRLRDEFGVDVETWWGVALD